jgi:hypothetical protein
VHNELAPTANKNRESIDEHGFAAVLGNGGAGRVDRLERDLGGIIGGPRVNPTRSGLWIEDSLGAAIDEILIGVLEAFERRERRGDLGETTSDARAPDRRATASRG